MTAIDRLSLSGLVTILLDSIPKLRNVPAICVKWRLVGVEYQQTHMLRRLQSLQLVQSTSAVDTDGCVCGYGNKHGRQAAETAGSEETDSGDQSPA
jgi:hypothetical protein